MQTLTEAQIEVRDATRRFSRERLLPHYMRREREVRLDRELVRELGSLGLNPAVVERSQAFFDKQDKGRAGKNATKL